MTKITIVTEFGSAEFTDRYFANEFLDKVEARRKAELDMATYDSLIAKQTTAVTKSLKESE